MNKNQVAKTQVCHLKFQNFFRQNVLSYNNKNVDFIIL